MTYEDLDALMAARHSCRAFRPDPVPRAVIEKIIATARRVGEVPAIVKKPKAIAIVASAPAKKTAM